MRIRAVILLHDSCSGNGPDRETRLGAWGQTLQNRFSSTAGSLSRAAVSETILYYFAARSRAAFCLQITGVDTKL